MRMPEPEEGKVIATGGGLHASRLLKLSGVRRSLLKKGLYASPSQQLFTSSDFQTNLTTLSGSHLAHTFVLQSTWSTLHVSLREASLRMRMSSNIILPVDAVTWPFLNQLLFHQSN